MKPQKTQKASGLHKTYALLLCFLCFLWLPVFAVYVTLTPDGLIYSDEPPPSNLSPLTSDLVYEGAFPRYVVARERTSDGAKSPLLVFDSKLRAQAAADNPPDGWQTIPVEQWQLERLKARTGRRHVGLENGE